MLLADCKTLIEGCLLCSSRSPGEAEDRSVLRGYSCAANKAFISRVQQSYLMLFCQDASRPIRLCIYISTGLLLLFEQIPSILWLPASTLVCSNKLMVARVLLQV